MSMTNLAIGKIAGSDAATIRRRLHSELCSASGSPHVARLGIGKSAGDRRRDYRSLIAKTRQVESSVSHSKQTTGALPNRQKLRVSRKHGNRALESALRLCAAVIFLFSIFCAGPAAAQTAVPGDLWSDLRDFVLTPSVSGYERELSEKIRAKIAAFHPVVDNLGDVIVTIGSGSPRRLIVAPIDEPGFIVSGITDEGYLRLQRLPQTGLPPIFNQLYSAQPVKVGTGSGAWIDGVVAGISVHLHRAGEKVPDSGDIENMYVDIGASSAAEVRGAGVDILSPIVINRQLARLDLTKCSGASVGDKIGAVELVELLRDMEAGDVQGTLIVVFVVQQLVGGRGLDRILRTMQADEMIYVGRMLPGGNIPGMEGVHRAPRREPGSGVLVGFDKSNGEFSGLSADLKGIADSHDIKFVADYSADFTPNGYLPPPTMPARWAHIGVATSMADTPAETVDLSDADSLVDVIDYYLHVLHKTRGIPLPLARIVDVLNYFHRPTRPSTVSLLRTLIETYSVSGHEDTMRDAVKKSMPEWAKPETDDAGNLILHVGTAPAGAKTPKILVVAHMDEIGFEVKSISKDGRLEVETLGGMDLSFYEGHPVLIHHYSESDGEGIMELPNGWDEPNFKWPAESAQTIRVDVGARNPEDVAKLGIKVGDSVTIPKKYRPLLGTRANGRSFDDRVGDTALISAVWALGGPLKDRDVTFAWSTREEIGLEGAAALAKRLAAEGRTPDYVFAVDTVVSSDSPLESKRFADVQLGKGFGIRAVDDSNIDPGPLVNRLTQLARANRIPFQLGVTSGGNDGSTFVPYGSVDIALGWPLRYSHSPAEVIDARDVDALARIVAAIATSW